MVSVDFCSISMCLVSASMDACSASPMTPVEQEATDDGEDNAGAVVGCVEVVAAGGGSAADEEEDRCDRDTRLSRASIPKIARPRLRSS